MIEPVPLDEWQARPTVVGAVERTVDADPLYTRNPDDSARVEDIVSVVAVGLPERYIRRSSRAPGHG